MESTKGKVWNLVSKLVIQILNDNKKFVDFNFSKWYGINRRESMEPRF